MLRQRRRSLARRRRGGALLEFALVVPVLISLLLGMLEVGRGYMALNSLTTAAREGARTAVLPNGDNTKAMAAVTSSLTSQGIPTANASTTIKVNGSVANASTAVTGNSVSVTVSVPYNAVSWAGVGRFLAGRTLTATVVMRRE